MQQDWIGYAILFFAFCVAPVFIITLIGGTIWWLRRSAKNTPPPPRWIGEAGSQPMKTNQSQPAKKAATASAPRPQAPRPTPAAAPASRAVTPARTTRVQPTTLKKSGGPFTPIYLNFSNKPNAIIESMNSLTAQAAKVSAARTRWSKGPRTLFWLGLALIGVEVLLWFLGYGPSCIFLTGGIGLWVVGIFLSMGLRRAQVQEFPPRFDEFEQMIHTLRDDLRPGTGFIGNLDLTGARQSSKVARSANDARGRTIQYFRDQWLNFKAKMYDGNILRVSGIQRIKERNGYWGRGRVSGKTKWKPAKLKGAYQELKVRIAVNDQVYHILRNSEIKDAKQVGEYTINAVDTDGGIVTVLASSGAEEVSAQSVLGVLKFAYGMLEMKKA